MKVTPVGVPGAKARLSPRSVFLPFIAAWPEAWHALGTACAISSGRAALDCVEVPPGLEGHLSKRARRLVRQARISAW